MSTRTSIHRVVLITFTALLADNALAQAYPSRPVRIILGAAPGGNTDTVARALASQFSAAMGQPFVIENRPGAAGCLHLSYSITWPVCRWTTGCITLPLEWSSN
jgi:tripartite-type tricarboxylate transporter receptor subunit TctC